MKKYKVLVRGQNFLLDLNGQVEKVGFYTTRFVEAENEGQAEDNAISMLRADSKLCDVVLNPQSDTPMLFVEEITQLDSFEGVGVPGAGFTFYRESQVCGDV